MDTYLQGPPTIVIVCNVNLTHWTYPKKYIVLVLLVKKYNTMHWKSCASPTGSIYFQVMSPLKKMKLWVIISKVRFFYFYIFYVSEIMQDFY